MKYVTKPMMQQLITSLRTLAPNRPLSYGESIQVARLQAARVRTWLGSDSPDINLIWLRQQRAVPVSFVPSYRLGEDSGITTNAVSGRLEIFINEQEPHQRQRFSLLHEFKHVLDFDDASTLHARLGSGDVKRRALQIELICNDFAAHVLMPTALVKRAWFESQNLSLCATLFNVSPEAMSKRLAVLGLIGEPKSQPRTYFRRAALLPVAA
jgi:uncharacterized protein DUF955